MRSHGGFDHNAQSLKHVTQLERRYAGFDGLNLSWETLEGLAKHNGPVRRPAPYLARYNAVQDLELGTHASAEAQVAALADDIAYNNHDLEDGLRAGLFTVEEVAAMALPRQALAEARAAHPDLPADRAAPEMVRRVIAAMIRDVAEETERRLATLSPANVEAIRAAPQPVVAFGAAMRGANAEMREFLFERMYRHFRVNRASQKSKRVVQILFQLLHGGPQMLPDEWRARAGEAGSPQAAETVGDYIAGMTDRFALEEYRRLTDPHVGG